MSTSTSEKRDYGWLWFGVVALCALPFALLSIGGLVASGQAWATTYGVTGSAGTVTLIGYRSTSRRSPAQCYGEFRSDRGVRTPLVKVEHSGDCAPGQRVQAQLSDGTAYERGWWSWGRFATTALILVIFLVSGAATLGTGGAFVQLAFQHFRQSE